jgi:SSS family solute:Na+ symporter
LAVVLTESIQALILVLGAVCITAIALYRADGWSGLAASVEPVKLTILRPHGDSSGLPWYSVFLGYPVIGIWYWCADQTIVQRVLGARDENHARVGPLFTGFIKILPVFIFVLPGLICLGLINQGKLPNEIKDSADTYAFMITHLLPVGLKGIVAAALLAALMSTVSGALNSIATLFSYDIFKRWHPQTSDKQLVIVGRLATFAAMIIAIAWSPFVSHYASIFQGINAVICYISPPITAVFLFGVFWRRASDKAAFTTLLAGSVMGLVVFLLDWFRDTAWLRQFIHWNVPFMMASFYLFVLCSIIMIVVSMFRPHKHTAESDILVWDNPADALHGKTWKGFGNYKFLAGLLFVIMVTLYIIFA